MDDRLGHAYNEEAFRYLLTVSQRRSQRSNRACLLLLIDLKDSPGNTPRIDPPVARKLFASLWSVLREADVIGWYREEQVAGAVLTQFDIGTLADVAGDIAHRVTDVLSQHLPAHVSPRLQVRVCPIQPRLKS